MHDPLRNRRPRSAPATPSPAPRLLPQQPDAIPAAGAPPITPDSTAPHEGLNETEQQ